MATDTTDITQLLREEKKSLLGFLVMLTGSRAEADDLFQDTYLEIWRLRDRFRLGSDFGAWARAIARNHVMRFWRRRKNDRHISLSPEVVDKLSERWGETFVGPEDELRERALKKCLKELGEEPRRAVQLRYREDWPIARIAHTLGRSVNGVKMALMRIRKKLQDCVTGKIGEEQL